MDDQGRKAKARAADSSGDAIAGWPAEAQGTTEAERSAKFEAILRLANSIDKEHPAPEQVLELREKLQQDEALWRRLSDLNRLAHILVLKKLPADMAEAAPMRLAAMQEELGYAQATPVERLLIEQVVTCWVALHRVQIEYAVRIGCQATSPAMADWDRRLTTAQRRYLKALATLTLLRKRLPLGAVQINIGAQQTNVIGLEPGEGKP